MNKFFKIALLALTVSAGPACAQTSCDAPFEVITTPKAPSFGIPTIWHATYQLPGVETQLYSGVPLEGGTVLAVGRKLSKEDYTPLEIVFAEINRRGRALREKSYPAQPGELPVRMMEMDKGYMVMSNVTAGKGNAERRVRLAWYDKELAYRRDLILKDATFDYAGHAILPAIDGGGFMAVVHARNRDNEEDQNGLLMRFSAAGELLWKRAYRPGIPNEIFGLIPIDSRSYLVTGRILMDDGRVAGWVIKIGQDGTVQWQRTYPRGNWSVLRGATISRESTAEGHKFLLVGQARPADGGPDAAWVLSLDALGEPQWQRYYRRPDAVLSGRWIHSNGDGRATLVINVESENQPDHVRLMTLSPLGALIGDEAYIQGNGAQARDFLNGWNGERIVVGSIMEPEHPPEDVKPEKEDAVVGPPKPEGLEPPPVPVKEKDVMKGWISVATALDPYLDPCAPRVGP